jgi:hypothetical protein
MREGQSRLRLAGGNIHLYRPRIGHTLDPAVGQAALDWFFGLAAEQTAKRIESAMHDGDKSTASVSLEAIARQELWHEAKHIEAAARVLEHLERPGRETLRRAESLLVEDRKAHAVELLAQVEAAYGFGKLGLEARTIRLPLEGDPQVRAEVAARAARRREQEAFDLYRAAQSLVAQRKLREAAQRCRHIVSLYEGTPAAERAAFLLNTIETAVQQ